MNYEQIVTTWRKLHITNAAELATALNGYVIHFAYHSGKIENDSITYNDTREIFEHDGVVNYTGDLRTLYEIRNAKDASNFVLDAFENRRPLYINFIRDLQYQIAKNTYDERRWKVGERPGTFKKNDYIVGRFDTGTAPEDVEAELDALLSEAHAIQPETKEQSLTVAAYLHAGFEHIHPFSDGNGRTGRLLMNYYLLLANHPPMVIHNEDKNLYYKSLEAYDVQDELEPLKLFLQAEIVKTWDIPYFRHKAQRLNQQSNT